MSDVSSVARHFWTGPRNVAEEGSWLRVRGSSGRRTGTAEPGGLAEGGGGDLALSSVGKWDGTESFRHVTAPQGCSFSSGKWRAALPDLSLGATARTKGYSGLQGGCK